MSSYCPEHPRYSAKRAPNSSCGKCWSLWHLRCPELKHDGKRILRDHAEAIAERLAEKVQRGHAGERIKAEEMEADASRA